MSSNTNTSDKAKYEAIGLIGSQAVYSLYENDLAIISKQELETLRKNDIFIQELLAAGFTEQELIENEKKIKKLVAKQLSGESQTVKAMKDFIFEAGEKVKAYYDK